MKTKAQTTRAAAGGKTGKAGAAARRKLTPAEVKALAGKAGAGHGHKALSKLPAVKADLQDLKVKTPTKAELMAQVAALKAHNAQLIAAVNQGIETHVPGTLAGNMSFGVKEAMFGAYGAEIQAEEKSSRDRYHDAHGEDQSTTMFNNGY